MRYGGILGTGVLRVQDVYDEQVTFNNIVTVINPSGVLISAECFPVASTKHCAWQVSE